MATLGWPSNARARTAGSLPFGSKHTGIDFPFGAGKAVFAVADGQVVSTASDPRYGLTVEIEHASLGGKRTLSRSRHLASVEPTIRPGAWVVRGQRVATMGNSGSLAEYVHLHFEFLVDGVRHDPWSMITDSHPPLTYSSPTPAPVPPLKEFDMSLRQFASEAGQQFAEGPLGILPVSQGVADAIFRVNGDATKVRPADVDTVNSVYLEMARVFLPAPSAVSAPVADAALLARIEQKLDAIKFPTKITGTLG